MGKRIVFDSSTVLAVMFREVAGDKLVDLMSGAQLSSVNLLEVHTKLLLRGLSVELARERISQLQCEICLLDEEQARIASEMIWQTRPFGLSLGDRACLALAIQRNAVVYTGDRAWQSIGLPVEIHLIR